MEIQDFINHLSLIKPNWSIEQMTEQLSNLPEEKKYYIISYSFRNTIPWSYATRIDNRTETHEFTKSELKKFIEVRTSWEEFKLITLTTV